MLKLKEDKILGRCPYCGGKTQWRKCDETSQVRYEVICRKCATRRKIFVLTDV